MNGKPTRVMDFLKNRGRRVVEDIAAVTVIPSPLRHDTSKVKRAGSRLARGKIPHRAKFSKHLLASSGGHWDTELLDGTSSLGKHLFKTQVPKNRTHK